MQVKHSWRTSSLQFMAYKKTPFNHRMIASLSKYNTELWRSPLGMHINYQLQVADGKGQRQHEDWWRSLKYQGVDCYYSNCSIVYSYCVSCMSYCVSTKPCHHNTPSSLIFSLYSLCLLWTIHLHLSSFHWPWTTTISFYFSIIVNKLITIAI